MVSPSGSQASGAAVDLVMGVAWPKPLGCLSFPPLPSVLGQVFSKPS